MWLMFLNTSSGFHLKREGPLRVNVRIIGRPHFFYPKKKERKKERKKENPRGEKKTMNVSNENRLR